MVSAPPARASTTKSPAVASFVTSRISARPPARITTTAPLLPREGGGGGKIRKGSGRLRPDKTELSEMIGCVSIIGLS